VVNALPGPKTGIGRGDLLRNTLILLRDYPFIGAGLGSYQMLYSTYALLIHVGFSVHSHNLLLNIAVEQGLLALLALGWMGLLFAGTLWRGLLVPRSASPDLGPPLQATGPLSLGLAALTLGVVLVHGMVDDVLYGSRAVLLLFVPLALAVPVPPVRQQRSGRWQALALPVGLISLLGLALLWRGPVLSHAYSNLGAVRQSQAELSLYSWPQWPIQDALRREVDLSQAVSRFERALSLDPRNATANRRLGMIDLSLADYESALPHLQSAYDVEPWSTTTRQLLGEALIVNGRLDEGQVLWARVSAEQGQLAARYYWYQHIDDAQRASWILQAAEGR
jgi:hypothetical protein